MECPVRWGSASLPPGLVVAMGFQQARNPPAVFGRGAERYYGTGSEHLHVGCLLSSLWHQALLLQSYSVVLCILAHGSLPGSEGWRSWGWGEGLAVTAWDGVGGFGNGDVLFATLFWAISLQHHRGDLLAVCDK